MVYTKFDWSDKLLLKNIVSNSNSIAECVKRTGLSHSGVTYKRLRFYCQEYGISLDFEKPYSSPFKLPDDKIFIENSEYLTNNTLVKNRMISNGWVEEKCNICNLPPLWMGKELVFHLDHINGIRSDYRRENLQLLCYNCHSQTENFTGKNRSNKNFAIHNRRLNTYIKNSSSTEKPMYTPLISLSSEDIIKRCNGEENLGIAWEQDEELLKYLVTSSSSIAECFRRMQIKETSSNYSKFKKACSNFSIKLVFDTSVYSMKYSDEELFVQNSTVKINSVDFKGRLIRSGRVYECSTCDIKEMWQEKYITLQLDHINGVNNDHRKSNLRFLCPNCHSQTDTFMGRNAKKEKRNYQISSRLLQEKERRSEISQNYILSITA